MANVALFPAQDAYVNSLLPTTSFPGSLGDSKILVGYDMAYSDGTIVPGYCEGWLLFDLSSIPPGSTLISATLGIGTYMVFGDSTYDTIFQIHIDYMGDNSWTEAALNYLNAPNASLIFSAADFDVSSSTPGNFFLVDVLLATETAFPTGALSLRLQLNSHYGLGYGVYFQGHEFTEDNIQPHLIIEYDPPIIPPDLTGGDYVVQFRRRRRTKRN